MFVHGWGAAYCYLKFIPPPLPWSGEILCLKLFPIFGCKLYCHLESTIPAQKEAPYRTQKDCPKAPTNQLVSGKQKTPWKT